MARHLHELLPDIPFVQLSPDQLSVYARQQSQQDRICTVEALALFLKLYGVDSSQSQELIDCVKINNSALRRKPNSAQLQTIASSEASNV